MAVLRLFLRRLILMPPQSPYGRWRCAPRLWAGNTRPVLEIFHHKRIAVHPARVQRISLLRQRRRDKTARTQPQISHPPVQRIHRQPNAPDCSRATAGSRGHVGRPEASGQSNICHSSAQTQRGRPDNTNFPPGDRLAIAPAVHAWATGLRIHLQFHAHKSCHALAGNAAS